MPICWVILSPLCPPPVHSTIAVNAPTHSLMNKRPALLFLCPCESQWACSGQLLSPIYPGRKINCCLSEGISRLHPPCPREQDKRVESQYAVVWRVLGLTDFQTDCRNHFLGLLFLFFSFHYKESSLAKGCEQFGKPAFSVTLQTHERNTAWLG